jgi:putative two-component system response regulator
MSDRVLVCDDDPGVRGVLSRLLVHHGFRVQTVESGEQALAAISHTPPDLILLDVNMPGMDGLEVCRRVRRMRGGDLLPIVLVTGVADTTARVLGLDAGADEFAAKPIESEILISRIRSLLRVKHITDQLERTENVIFALARTVEVRDAYTDRHLWRIAEYSQAMALALGCCPEEARYAWYGGVLHDIGKIGIDPNVLGKPGALTREEFDEVKRHPELGATIVASMRFAPIVAPIVRSHHERWDGQGYPANLSGDDIPLAARLISVADAYDAMTTDRPYRRALDKDEALRRLRAGRGEQWDRTAVDVFVNLLRHDELPRPQPGHELWFVA